MPVRILLRQCLLFIGMISLIFPFHLCAQNPKVKTNILLILADDMGYSDLSCYGSEIQTPHLDQLAKEGIKFSRFYNSARCCPSRAALLTGRFPQEAGMGGMVSRNDASSEKGPYQGYLHKDLPTAAELFRAAGYATLISGKWHVGETFPNWPLQRGFDRYFGLISGASSYYEILPHRLMLNQNEPFTPKDGFYATDAYADSSLSFMLSAVRQGKPFFCYTAFTAPHWPLHAPDSVVKKYRDRYKKGWDRLREERLDRQVALGILKAENRPDRWSEIPKWENIQKPEAEAEKMAVYAAMVEIMDAGIGRMLEGLKKAGVYDNTLIVFLSDNGACHETIQHRSLHDGMDTALIRRLPPGPKGSYVAYGKNWAYLSNTPFRYHKTTIYEGGVASAFIMKWAGNQKPSTLQPGYITDLLPTALEAAGLKYPQKWTGNLLQPLPGRSLFQTKPPSKSYAWEHEGNRGIREGDWKLVALKGKSWSLFHLGEDPHETQDRASAEPSRVQSMEAAWLKWARTVGAKVP